MHCTSPSSSPLVYDDILCDLLKSTMKAQAELIECLKSGINPDDIPDQNINKHFSWLVRIEKEGVNRHFNSITGNQAPLRLKNLRARELPEYKEIYARLSARMPVYDQEDDSIDTTTRNKFARNKPTRISSLIKQSFKECIEVTNLSKSEHAILAPSPLTVVLQFLTAPEMPGTKSYALFSLRNYLFYQFNLSPDLHRELAEHKLFTARDVENSLSHILTSISPRYESKGDDKLPAGKIATPDALLRHYLTVKGLFYLRFNSVDTYERFLKSGSLLPSKSRGVNYEYSKSPYLERLPETAELVNELFGLPIPLRGADTIFKGGLKFSARQGLVVALHGGPGAGKTSLALGLCASVAPFQIETLFLTAEESKADLQDRIDGLIPDEIRRLSFFSENISKQIKFHNFKIPHGNGDAALVQLIHDIDQLALALGGQSDPQNIDTQNSKNTEDPDVFEIQKPCRLVVVLDGLHDLFANIANSNNSGINKICRLYELIDKLKDLKALVILTTGQEWEGDASLDYLVDVAIRLSHDSIGEYGSKPDRRIQLTKARHQLCAAGVHGVQIAGSKGVRFLPQINYQLDQRTVWKTRLPDKTIIKPILKLVAPYKELMNIPSNGKIKSTFTKSKHAVDIYKGSHVFINGEGSGGKAALALKIATAPSFYQSKNNDVGHGREVTKNKKILVVSFLYPEQYYNELLCKLESLHGVEYPKTKRIHSNMKVFHLYPGHLKPNALFNRIEWELDAAELYGDPYTCVIIDGIHNVFLQFPAIEQYSLFWPQIYSSLRTRPITTITTHTTLAVPREGCATPQIDDNRSEPLRHALVQKTDFQLEVDPFQWNGTNNHSDEVKEEYKELPGIYTVKTVAAIGQPLPTHHVLWSRERLIFTEDPTLK